MVLDKCELDSGHSRARRMSIQQHARAAILIHDMTESKEYLWVGVYSCPIDLESIEQELNDSPLYVAEILGVWVNGVICR